MEDLLNCLLETHGVLGAILLSQDGLTIASANLDEDEAETVSALAISTIASMRLTSDRLAVGDLHEATLTTAGGRIEIHLLEGLVLLIFGEPDLDRATLDSLLVDVKANCLALIG